jgi:ATP-dependent RNA helicase MSS116
MICTIAGPCSCARRWIAAKSEAPTSDDRPSSITAASVGKPLPKGSSDRKSALTNKGESLARLGPSRRGGAKYQKFGQNAEKTLKTWESLNAKLNPAITKVVALDHIRWSHMTPVQSQVLEFLPGLANPHTPGVPNEGRKDILICSPTGTGKTAAFLIPTIEARQRAIRTSATKAVARAGLVSSKEQENSSMRVYSRTRVGALILCPTREAATQVANDAIRLSHFYQGFEVRLLVGGMSKKQQMRDWMLGRRDIVVSTPGRLRDLLYSEPDIVEGLRTVQNVCTLPR